MQSEPMVIECPNKKPITEVLFASYGIPVSRGSLVLQDVKASCPTFTGALCGRQHALTLMVSVVLVPGTPAPATLQLKDAGGRYPWCDEGLSSLSVEPSCHYEKSKEVLAEECVGKDSCSVVAARSVATAVSVTCGVIWHVFQGSRSDWTVRCIR